MKPWILRTGKEEIAGFTHVFDRETGIYLGSLDWSLSPPGYRINQGDKRYRVMSDAAELLWQEWAGGPAEAHSTSDHANVTSPVSLRFCAAADDLRTATADLTDQLLLTGYNLAIEDVLEILGDSATEKIRALLCWPEELDAESSDR